jgi:trigger factor
MSFVYKGLKAQLDRHIVTGEEIDRQIQRLQQQNPRIAVIKDRPTEQGDEVVLDYAGFCDGVQFAGGTAEKQTLVLGSGMFIPGFEEQLLDKVPGEPVTVHVTFPEQYHSDDLAGKAAEFRCVIHEIRVKTAYDLDDVFAKEVGGCETMEEMRQRMGESLQAYADEQGEMELQDQLLRQAADSLEVTFTAEQLEKAVEEQMDVMKAQLSQQGLSLEMYCSFMKTTEEAIREDTRGAAISALQNQAAVEEIVRLEEITVTEQEMAEAKAIICRRNGITMEQLKEYYDESFEKAVIRSVQTGKVMCLIRDAAIITEV